MEPQNKSKPTPSRPSRLKFLKRSAQIALSATALPELGQKIARGDLPAKPLLPTIKLGKHEVTRLILGGNPIYGYSHFNKLLSQYQTAWHTPERVQELLHHAET